MLPSALIQVRPSAINLKNLLQTAREGRRTVVMGILNITPDSFSDGGRFLTQENAAIQAQKMVEDGADILDIGGESTRPATFRSSDPLDTEEELRRILPIIEYLTQYFPEIPISVDTYKSSVAIKAVEAGAAMINDISALRADLHMRKAAGKLGVPVCLMHMPGLPMNIPAHPEYKDIAAEVKIFLDTQIEAALKAGISRENLVIDPGFGFGKSVVQNLQLLRRLPELIVPGIPMLSGTSRKSMIGKTLGDLPPDQRVEGTAATVAISIMNGASLIRVHDVKEMSRVAKMTDAVMQAG